MASVWIRTPMALMAVRRQRVQEDATGVSHSLRRSGLHALANTDMDYLAQGV